MNLYRQFLGNVHKHPDRIAVWCEGSCLTYEDLNGKVAQCSQCFEDNGVKYKDHLAVVLQNTLDFVVVMLTCANLGVTIVPLSPHVTYRAFRKLIAASDAKHIVSVQQFFQSANIGADSIDGTMFSTDSAEDGIVAIYDNNCPPAQLRVNESVTGEEPYILTMTSGSTGTPKPIILTQNIKYSRAMATVDLYQLSSDDVILAATPLYHSLAERLVLLPLILGGQSVIMNRFTPSLWLETVKEQMVTFTVAVSSQLAQIAAILSSPFSPQIVSLRCIASSSALLEPHIKLELISKLRCEVHENYGTSEVAFVSNLNVTDSRHKYRSVGKPIAGVEVRIMKDDGILAKAMERGEIQVKTPLLFDGYYNQQKQTQDSVKNGFFCTGDIGYQDEDGYLYYAGRSKDIIISGAVNVYPTDIEEVVSEYDGVRECAAFALPDDRLGEVVGLAVVEKKDMHIDLRKLRFFFLDNLADYQIPRKVFILDELPKNEIGKTMKNSLVAQFGKVKQSLPKPIMQDKIRVGVIGGGPNSAIGKTHIAAIRISGRFSIISGCFSRMEPPERVEYEYGVPKEKVYSDWRVYLEKEATNIDAVIILLPIPDHNEVAGAFLSKNIPVICEKPLVSNTKDALALLKKREEKKGFLAVTYNYTGYPMVRELRDMIDSEALGTVTQFHAEMLQEGYVREGAAPQAWRLQETDPTMLSLDLLTHLHHIIDYLLGRRPIAVYARSDNFGLFQGITDNIMCLADYTEAVQGQYWVSKATLGNRNGMRIRIYGTKAAVLWDQENPECLCIAYANGRKEILDRGSCLNVANQARYCRFKAGHPSGYIEAFANVYEDIWRELTCYEDKSSVKTKEVTSVEQEIDRLKFIEAVALSIRRAKKIALEK